MLVAACGGGGGHVDAPSGRGGIGGAQRELVLYRDGALIRERYEVTAQAGDTVVAVALPADVDAGEIDAHIVAGEAHVGAVTVVEAALRPGDEVDVIDGDRTISGILRNVSAGQLVLETGGEVRLLLGARHVVRKRGGGARRIDCVVASAKGGPVVLEVTYVTRQLRWRADYTLVMDPAAKLAELHGALGIDNAAGTAYADARITLFDVDRPVTLAALDQTVPDDDAPVSRKVEDPTKPRAEQPSAKLEAKKKLVETPRTTLPFTVDVVTGAQAVSLLDGAPELEAEQTLVFDPVGDTMNLTGKQPIYDRDYGLERSSGAVSQSIDIDLHGGALPAGLPAGTVRLLERAASGALAPLGEARIFERAGTNTEELSPTTSVAVGRAPMLEGKRFRREYTLDEDAKRLVEEFEIELTSTADRPLEVIVREHMYRGQNWKLVYSAAEHVAKEGPQKVALRTTVPAGGKARVVYRILYYWD